MDRAFSCNDSSTEPWKLASVTAKLLACAVFAIAAIDSPNAFHFEGDPDSSIPTNPTLLKLNPGNLIEVD